MAGPEYLDTKETADCLEQSAATRTEGRHAPDLNDPSREAPLAPPSSATSTSRSARSIL